MDAVGKTAAEAGTHSTTFTAPSVTAPKGGGAIRGMGEKLAANPVNGRGSLAVPIAVSPGRSGFGPDLTLSYDSGASNYGCHGFGMRLSAPAITCQTDKGIPRYRNDEESDVFILSGAEDLVPVLERSAGKWRQRDLPYQVGPDSFSVRRYRPRVEGLFARIERWTSDVTGDVHWRSITTDNVTTLYGADADSRIFDPAQPRHVFSWLISQSYDSHGNVIVYEYKAEDSRGIAADSPGDAEPLTHERNRTETTRSSQRYLKRIKYGGVTPYYPDEDPHLPASWLFEVVFDYGEGHFQELAPDARGRQLAQAESVVPADAEWPVRLDPVSTYRAGFEIRTYRLCRRILMFHHFPPGADGEAPYDGLVSATEFGYRESPVASYLTSIVHAGFRKLADGTYLKKALPPLELSYSHVSVDTTVYDVDPESLENLPSGLAGDEFQWADLDGDGIAGILAWKHGGWYFKQNLSPLADEARPGADSRVVRFGPLEAVPVAVAGPLGDSRQLFDADADGRPDLVELSRPHAGYFGRGEDNGGWEPFRSFASQPTLDWGDGNVRLVDLTGDGYPDLLLTEHDALTWYPSLVEEGFGPAERVWNATEEEAGPRLVFADGTDTVFLADMSGDGLSDLVRIRGSEICYWPSRGYATFGPKITMDNSPRLDPDDRFEPARIRLADIDGSGATDLIYLDARGASLYFNQSGNSWSDAYRLDTFPEITNDLAVRVVDLFGNGTACLVWSSELPGDARRPMRYIDLMGGQKPHLLTAVVNNRGAETRVQYASSTRFRLQDKLAGRPWKSALPPMQVVETVETVDRISRNRFVTRFAYHHGRYDWKEREHGFGQVDQWDTEEFGVFDRAAPPGATNAAAASHVPPVLTRTWYHSGGYRAGEEISRQFAREYFGAPPPDAPDFATRLAGFIADLLPDTVIPDEIRQADTIREACRALMGKPLRREVYAEDGTPRQGLPYSVTESNYTMELVQPREQNRHAVLFAHPRETISFHTERDPEDARVTHDMVLKVDPYGNVERSVTIAYPRRPRPDREPEQAQTHILLTLSRFAHEDKAQPDDGEDWYRAGAPVETRTYELVRPPAGSPRLGFGAIEDLTGSLVPAPAASPPDSLTIPCEQWDWRAAWDPVAWPGGGINTRLRLIAHARTRYRADDLGALLPLGAVSARGLPGETLQLALTPGLVTAVYGARVDDAMLVAGGYVHSEGDASWWIPSGRVFYHAAASAPAATELIAAKAAFFQPCRFRDPFGSQTRVSYDGHQLLLLGSEDVLGNQVTAGERRPGQLVEPRLDYRVLQPTTVTDPNGNRTAVAFDVLGMVVGTAVMGKVDEVLGDLIDDTFDTDLDDGTITSYLAAPLGKEVQLVSKASTRIVYDVDAYRRTRQQPEHQPVTISTLTRETHYSDALAEGLDARIQVSFSYYDGSGQDLQKKVYADPGPLTPDGPANTTRYLRSAWARNNNKGLPYRRFEPDYTATHRFEFGAVHGVSSTLFYDPLDRVVATLHPNHAWEKVTFTAWEQTTWDVNDTTGTTAEALADPDAGPYLQRLYPGGTGFTSWFDARRFGQLGDEEQAAATKTLAHAGTPTTVCHDALGRPFLNLARNRFRRNGTTIDQEYPTSTVFDIKSCARVIRDAKRHQTDPSRRRTVMRYDYDLLGTQVRQRSMEAGERLVLNDVAGKPAYAWDSRNNRFRTSYDVLRRPTDTHLRAGSAPEILVGRNVHGESRANPHLDNLRGRVVTVFDQAGIVTTPAYDFKGNLVRTQRQLAQIYDTTIDWSHAVAREPEIYVSATRYDALNRPIQLVAPHSDQPGTAISVTQNVYNQLGQLKQVHVWLDLTEEPGTLLDPTTADLHPVTDIAYNAKGQRTRLDRGTEGGRVIRTSYTYDRETFRLIGLYTRRGVDLPTGESRSFAADCDDPAAFPPAVGAPETPPPGRYCGLQNLHYTYDPSGNITHIRDDAQQTVFFKNTRVEPSSEYTYDALYRLTAATGREHLGQSGSPIPHSYNDAGRIGLPHPADQNTLGRYVEEYVYDEVGNFLTMRHRRTDAQIPGWSRIYTYAEDSQLDPGEFASNRLTSTSVGSRREIYSTTGDGYDAHGSMRRMPHLPEMRWDFRDQLQMTRRQAVSAGDADGKLHDGERTWYVYDSAGQRVRKISEAAPGAVKNERIYLGSLELYRRYGGTPVVRETLHVMDGTQRVALIDTRTQGSERRALRRVVRYQLGNHLGSAILELTHRAEIISYEENGAWGVTNLQVVRGNTEASKRYRYIGKERDEESGLYYHGVRYYAPWTARWTACDPAGTIDGLNLYVYTRANPVRSYDNTGMNGGPFAELFGLVDDKKVAVADPRPPLTPRATPWTSTTARAYGNVQAARTRASDTMTQADVWAGHTAAARHAVESGISEADWDTAPFQHLQSSLKSAPTLAGSVTDQSGQTRIGTRHLLVQEGMIDEAVDRARTALGTLTPRGQLDAASDVVWKTQGTKLDQREIDVARASGTFDEAAAIERNAASKDAVFSVAKYRADKLASPGVGGTSAAAGGALAGGLAKGASFVGKGAGTVLKSLAPGVGESLAVGEGIHIAAARLGITQLFKVTAGGAAAAGPAAAGGVVGLIAGHAGEALALAAGSSRGTAVAAGLLSAVAGGAVAGGLVGLAAGGVGAPAGAIFGGLAGAFSYLMARAG